MNYKNQILCGHTLDILKPMPDEIFDTIITSPPYWGLRDYGESTNTIWDGDPNCKHEWISKPQKLQHENRQGLGSAEVSPRKGIHAYKLKSGAVCSLCGAWYGQLGLEPTLDLYLSHLWQITDELYRVLKKTGVMYWNHSDCYGGTKTGNTNASTGAIGKPRYAGEKTMTFTKQAKGYAKCMMMQNYRLILGMIDIDYRILVEWRVLGRPEGKLEDMLKHPRIQQILRNNIIWSKPNHMPSSVKDRFTSSYEPIFMLTKNNKPQYYYNTKTGLMADKKPKELLEGRDWDWKDIEDSWQRPCRDETFKTPSRQKSTYATAKRKKVSYWKSIDYWFDLDAVRQPYKDIQDYNRNAPFNYRVKEAKKGHKGIIGIRSTEEEMQKYDRKGKARGPEYKGKWKDNQKYMNELQQRINDIRASGVPHDIALSHPSGKNPGDVWTIPTQPFPEAHFATFSEKLIEPMILSSCPQWICKKCGKARVRITKTNYEILRKHSKQGQPKQRAMKQQGQPPFGFKVGAVCKAEHQTIGWSDCGCNAGWVAGITFDPFIGSGTTGLVAKKLGRNYCGIELNSDYVKMATERISKVHYQEKLFD